MSTRSLGRLSVLSEYGEWSGTSTKGALHPVGAWLT